MKSHAASANQPAKLECASAGRIAEGVDTLGHFWWAGPPYKTAIVPVGYDKNARSVKIDAATHGCYRDALQNSRLFSGF
jgi:hypothetical protein